MDTERLSWLPPQGLGEPIVFTPEGAGGYALRRFRPSGNQASALGVKGARQMGETFSSAQVSPSVHVAQVYVLGASHEEHAALRAKLVKALSVDTLRAGGAALGTLRLERPGLPTLQTKALPQASPSWASRLAGNSIADLEFWAPSPLWSALEARSEDFSSSGGVGYPLDYPLDYEEVALRADVENLGDVSVGVLFRVFGAIENPVMELEATGERIVISGTVGAGEVLEVDTTFGGKSATLIASDGTRTNGFGMIDLEESTFWRLPSGTSPVRLGFDTEDGGSVKMAWREQYGGV